MKLLLVVLAFALAAEALRTHQLVVFNIGKLKGPLGSEAVSEFERALGPINDLALISPGYVWQYSPTDEERRENSRGIPMLEDELMMPQLSVWEDAESVEHYVIKSGHGSYLKRRKEWFDKLPDPYGVCYWRPCPEPWEPPTLAEAIAKMEMLKKEGSTAHAFHFREITKRPSPK
jgi:hypothetical protein